MVALGGRRLVRLQVNGVWRKGQKSQSRKRSGGLARHGKAAQELTQKPSSNGQGVAGQPQQGAGATAARIVWAGEMKKSTYQHELSVAWS